MRRVSLWSLLALICLAATGPARAAVLSPAVAWQTTLSGGSRNNYFLRDRSRWLADGTLVTAYCPLDNSLVIQRFDARLKRLSSHVLVFQFQPQLVALDPFGSVYTAGPVPSGNGLPPAELQVMKVDSLTGRPAWASAAKLTSPSETPGRFEPGTIFVSGGGDVVVSAVESPYGVVVCFDGSTGGAKWGPFRNPRASYAFDVRGDEVLVASEPRSLSKLSALDGSVLWGPIALAPTGETNYQDFLSFGSGGEVFDVQTRSVSGGGKRIVFSKRNGANGALEWETIGDAHPNAAIQATTVDDQGGVAVSGWIYDGSTSIGLTIRLSPLGEVLWTSPDLGDFVPNPYARIVRVAHNGDVLVSFQGNETPFWFLVDYEGATGAQRWTRKALNGLAIGPDGRVLASGYDPVRPTLLILSPRDGTTVAGPVATDYSSPVGVYPRRLGRDPKGDLVAVVLTGSGTSSAFKLHGSTGVVLWGPSVLDGAADQMAFDAGGDVWFLLAGSNNNGHAQKLGGATGKSIALSPHLGGGPGQYASLFSIRAAANGEAVISGSALVYDFFPSVLTAVNTWRLDSGGGIRWQRSLSGGTFTFDQNYPSRNPRPMHDADASGNSVVALASRLFGTSAVVKAVMYGKDGEVLWGPVTVARAGVDLFPQALAVGPANDVHVFSMSRVAPWNVMDVRLRLDSGSIDWASAPRPSAGPGAPLGILPDGAGGAFSFNIGPAVDGPRMNHLRALDGVSIWESLLPTSSFSEVAAVVGADGDPRVVSPNPYAADLLWRLNRDSGAPVYGPVALPTDVGDVTQIVASADGIIALSGGAQTFVTAYREKLTIATGPGPLPPAICGIVYAVELGAENETGAPTFALVSGSLPPGLSLSPAGLVGGMPSGTGAFAFRVRVTDLSESFERDFILDVRSSSDGVPVFADASPACPDGVRTLSVAGTWASYRWLQGGEATASIRVSPRERTTYGVVVTDASGCTSRGSIDVSGSRVPTPVILAPFEIVPEAEATATTDSQAGHAYSWTVENGSLTSGQGTATITFVAGASGPVTIRVIESDESGCPSAESVVVVGSAALSFRVLAPCRLIDTREPAGTAGGQPLAPNSRQVFLMTGACGVPATARALSLNVTAVSPGSEGMLSLFPGDAAVPTTSTLNYRTGQTRANNAIMGLSSDGTLGVQNNSTGPVDLVIDVTGWFE